MSGKNYPLTCKDVKAALRHWGFEARPRIGSSHEQWVKIIDGRIHKVTVDCPKAPFGQDLISSMARQAGKTKRDFYDTLKLI